jgi:predicted TIM-barrel fold metal-dependent hydrolase
VHSLARELPDRVIQFFFTDMSDDSVMQRLETSYPMMRFSGLKIHQAWTPFAVDGERFLSVVQFAERNRLPLFIHPYRRSDVKALLRLAHDFSNVNFIIAHLFCLHEGEAGRHRNIYHDVSPHLLSTAAVKRGIELYGADHVVFGSDYPFGDPSAGIQRIRRLSLTESEKDAILARNISGIIGF